MATIRNAPVAFRFDPDVKQALSIIAERDGRSMANMMEWLIRKHCEKEELGWPPLQAGIAKAGRLKRAKSAIVAPSSPTANEIVKKARTA